MRDLGSISASTRICAVIGNPLGHTLSPPIHNAAYDALNLDFVYVAFQTASAEPAAAALRALDNFRGLSVTIPHKVEIMRHVDEISALDRQIGSINTVVKEDGRLVGLGTDGPAAVKALSDGGVEVGDRKVLMLGAGGASRAIAFSLAKACRPEQIALVDIDPEVLDRLASDLRGGADTPIATDPASEEAVAARIKEADVIIHCTPIGMHPKVDASLVPPGLLRPEQAVFDVVYTPLKTRLIRDAEARGLKTVVGAEMFVNQAVLQFERFTGQSAPVEVMRDVVMEHLSQ